MSKLQTIKFKTLCDWFINTLDMVNSKKYTSGVISARLRKLDQKYADLYDAYEALLNVVDEKDQELVCQCDARYKEAEEIYNQLEAVSAAYPGLDGTHKPTESAPTARLPTINLPVFDGDIYSWTSFISLFSSLVLARNDISKTEKFHYLISHVNNEPKALIKHLSMIDSSLDSALEILRGRYENKRLLADSYISKLLNMPTMSRVTGLRSQILNPLLESYRALENLGLPVKEWSYILLHISLNKLPAELKNRFEHRFGGNNLVLPTFSELLDFLQNECRFIETSTDISVRTAHSDSAKYNTRVDKINNNKRNSYTRNIHAANLNQSNGSPGVRSRCAYCDLSNHTISKCFKFANLNTNSRRDFVKANSLCYKCFEPHTAISCGKQIPCDQCGHDGHHRLVCFGTRQTSPTRRAMNVQVADNHNGYVARRCKQRSLGTGVSCNSPRSTDNNTSSYVQCRCSNGCSCVGRSTRNESLINNQ